MARFIGFLALFGLSLAGMAPSSLAQSLYNGDGFTVTDTSVVQGDVRAVAASRTEIVSNYQRERTALNFKFSINGEDNEAPSGMDIRLRLSPADGRVMTPVYVFGERPDGAFPQPRVARPRTNGDSVAVTFRVDMRPVLRSFRETGSYDPPSGDPISEDDFRGVYIVGDTAPLGWNFGTVDDRGDRFRLTDGDGDGVYHTTLRFARRDVRPLNDDGDAVWTLSEDVSGFPQYRSDQRLVDALYNLSLEETLLNVREADGAFMAGAKWNGVWTRDISYSILLSLALVAPERAKTSLRAKVSDDGRVIQDTGTGGSWPVSSDRMTWALAAWEVYLTTGDRDWLAESYAVVQRAAEADAYAVYDSTTGLVHGEASFMDWREQSYPDWMDPKDIYESQVLSTNVVHYRTHQILAQMAEELGEPAETSARWAERAEAIKAGINEHLWVTDEGRYGSFRYGRNYKTLEPRAEALGSALAILTGVADADRAATTARQHPVTRYGVPSFWPYIPDIPPYHNAGFWPFVGSYWTWASAEAGNTPGVEHGLGTLYRAAALFLTNKENMVAQTGHFEGTQINSDRQLWSVAGTLASVYRVLFGMRTSPQGLRFAPFVPVGYTGTRTLNGMPYRDATLDIEMRGHGTRIVQMTLDGEPLPEPMVPADLSGEHTVTLVLSGGLPGGDIHLVRDRYTPATPRVQHDGAHLTWAPVDAAEAYRIYRNGRLRETTTALRYDVPPETTLAEYQVQAVGIGGLTSFLSEPVRVAPAPAVQTLDAAAFAEASARATDAEGYTGAGYLPISQTAHTEITVAVTVDQTGVYALDARYANGHGPVNTDNKCALRTVRLDGVRVGPLVLPQRGAGVWNDWGYSNPIRMALAAGTHTLTLALEPHDRTMNGEINAAYLDHLRLTRLDDPEATGP